MIPPLHPLLPFNYYRITIVQGLLPLHWLIMRVSQILKKVVLIHQVSRAAQSSRWVKPVDTALSTCAIYHHQSTCLISLSLTLSTGHCMLLFHWSACSLVWSVCLVGWLAFLFHLFLSFLSLIEFTYSFLNSLCQLSEALIWEFRAKRASRSFIA